MNHSSIAAQGALTLSIQLHYVVVSQFKAKNNQPEYIQNWQNFTVQTPLNGEQ